MNRLEEILKLLDDYKIENIEYIDVKDVSSLFDYMVVGTARSSQHAKKAADNIQYHFKPKMEAIPKSDGSEIGDWIAVDLDDVVLHIMLEEERNKYKLEELWQELKKLYNASDN